MVTVPAVPPNTASSSAALFQVWNVVPLCQNKSVVFQLPVPPPPGVTPSGLHCKSAALAVMFHASAETMVSTGSKREMHRDATLSALATVFRDLRADPRRS
jgi:hypothetical protein